MYKRILLRHGLRSTAFMLGGKNPGTSEACAGCRMNEEDFQYRVNEKMALKGGPDFMCRDRPKFTCRKKLLRAGTFNTGP